MTWYEFAACRDSDPELFFPLGSGPATERQERAAKAVCGFCPVRAECLRQALDAGEVGVWGGTTDDERRALRARVG